MSRPARLDRGPGAATAREVVAGPGCRAVYVVGPDAGSQFPRLVVAGSELSRTDEADRPHVVTTGCSWRWCLAR